MNWSKEEILSIVRSEVADILIIDPSQLEQKTLLVEYGLDSIQAMDIVLAMEERFRIEIEADEMHDVVSVADIVELVQKNLIAESSL